MLKLRLAAADSASMDHFPPYERPGVTPTNPTPFAIQSSAGTIVGRYASSSEAFAALPAATKAVGDPCRIVY